jgi:hypothetical protein
MTRRPGPVQRWVLNYLQEAAANEGESRWFSVSDLTRLRLGQDDPPSRSDIDATRKAITRLERDGAVQVGQQPRPVTRVVISPVVSGQPTQIVEERQVICIRLTPIIDQLSGKPWLRFRSKRSRWRRTQAGSGHEGSWSRPRRQPPACGASWRLPTQRR